MKFSLNIEIELTDDVIKQKLRDYLLNDILDDKI